MKRASPRVGDVLTIPVGSDRLGVAQVVAKYGKSQLYFAIFEKLIDPTLRDLDSALSSPIVLLGLSLDAKIWAGHWRIVGSRAVAPDVPLPAYREAIGTPENIEIVDYSGKRRRRARGVEAVAVPRRVTVAPVRLEKALRARHGLEAWLPDYDELVPSAYTTSALFGISDP